MKQSPQDKKLEQTLRSSKLVAGGFMGADARSANEIIEADLSELALLGRTPREVAERMQRITDTAKAGLETWVLIDDARQAMVEEARGILVCPWAHPGRFNKRVTVLKLVQSGEMLRWSDLNIHLIAQHGFFEGRGSSWRLEPRELVRFIF